MQTTFKLVPHPHATPTHGLWNPRATVNWSIPFSPAFGAYLQMLNWQALGEHDRAEASKRWFFASLFVFALYPLIYTLAPSPELAQPLVFALVLVFFKAWFYGSGRDQIRYTEEEFDEEYVPLSWRQPLLYALAAVLGWFAVSVAAGLVGAAVGVA